MMDDSPHALDQIWMTGSSGFIGRYAAQSLQGVCRNLRCFTNQDSSRQPLLMNYADPDSILGHVKTFGAPDVFVHLGWGAMTDPGSDEHLTKNVDDTKSLISTLFQAGLKRFVFLGSVNEYGARTGILTEELPAEGRRTNYAIGKTMVCDYGLEKAAELGCSYASIRLFYTYGAGQRKGSLINKLFNCCQNNEPADLGPCEHFRDYIYVEDVAEGIKRIALAEPSGIVNLGGGDVITVQRFVEKLWDTMGGDPEKLLFGANPMREGEPEQPKSYAGLDRLQQWTNWTPKTGVDEGLRKTVELLKSQQSSEA